MAQAKKKVELSASQKLGIGVGLTAAAVAAAGAYFLYGSEDAPKNRTKVKSWMLKAKGDVLQKLEVAEHMTEEEFTTLIDKVLTTYNKAQTISKKELKDFKAEMIQDWGGLITSGVAKVLTADQIAKKKAAKKAVKKAAPKTAAKKVAKKTAKKTDTAAA